MFSLSLVIFDNLFRKFEWMSLRNLLIWNPLNRAAQFKFLKGGEVSERVDEGGGEVFMDVAKIPLSPLNLISSVLLRGVFGHFQMRLLVSQLTVIYCAVLQFKLIPSTVNSLTAFYLSQLNEIH